MKLYVLQFFSSSCLCNEMLWDQSVLCDEALKYFRFMLYVMNQLEILSYETL